MIRMSLTEFIKMMRIDRERKVSTVRGEIEPRLPIEITYDGEIVFKIVPKTWRNPAFPIH